MTQEELIQEIKQLPLDRQREVLDVILRELREKTPPHNDRTSSVSGIGRVSKTDNSPSETQPDEFRDGDLSISQRLYGILKFEGAPPTDDEVKDMIADYLIEKYS